MDNEPDKTAPLWLSGLGSVFGRGGDRRLFALAGGGLDNVHSDIWHQVAGQRYQPRHVVIVAIDDQTRLEHQDEPLVFWAPYFARAIEVLRKAGARAIGVDVLISASAEAWLKKRQLASDESRTYDLELRKQLATGQVVLAASLITDEQGKSQVILAVETKFQDMHLTPYARGFLRWRPRMMSGPEVHANIVETLLAGRSPEVLAGLWRFAVIGAVLALATLTFFSPGPLAGAGRRGPAGGALPGAGLRALPAGPHPAHGRH